MTEKNLYEILGVDKDSTGAVIKRAYKVLCSTNHPDKGGDEEEFKIVQLAYAVLSDAERRAKYDATGSFSKNVSNASMLIRDELVRLFMTVISSNINAIGMMDISKTMQKMIDSQVSQLTSANYENTKQVEKLSKLIGKIAYKGECDDSDYLTLSIKHNISQLETFIEQSSERIDFLQSLKDEVDNFTFSTNDQAPAYGPTIYISNYGSF